MKKKELFDYLNEALKDVPDDVGLILGDSSDPITYTGQLLIEVVCGKTQALMPYYCVRPPNHEGDCYCPCKDVYFKPDTEEEIKEIYDSINK